MKNISVIIIVIGLIMTTVTGFNIITKKKVVDLGAVQISRKETTPVYWSPITGGVLVVAGVVLFALASNKKI